MSMSAESRSAPSLSAPLLDTHAWEWSASRPERLPNPSAPAIERARKCTKEPTLLLCQRRVAPALLSKHPNLARPETARFQWQFWWQYVGAQEGIGGHAEPTKAAQFLERPRLA